VTFRAILDGTPSAPDPKPRRKPFHFRNPFTSVRTQQFLSSGRLGIPHGGEAVTDAFHMLSMRERPRSRTPPPPHSSPKILISEPTQHAPHQRPSRGAQPSKRDVNHRPEIPGRRMPLILPVPSLRRWRFSRTFWRTGHVSWAVCQARAHEQALRSWKRTFEPQNESGSRNKAGATQAFPRRRDHQPFVRLSSGPGRGQNRGTASAKGLLLMGVGDESYW
jgi:hypothetical protein